MLYEVELIRAALQRVDKTPVGLDQDDELRLQAEQIVYSLHQQGFRLTTDSEPSFDD